MPSLPISETTRALVLAAKRGDQDATETLVLRHRPVRGIVEKLKRECDPNRIARGWEPKPGPDTPDESEAAARLGVLDALNRYDPDRGVAFTTFAYPFIKGEVLSALYVQVHRSGDERPPVRIVPLVTDDGDEPDAPPPSETDLLKNDPSYGTEAGYGDILVIEEYLAVRRFVDQLPDYQQSVVLGLFFDGRTQDDLAAERGVTRQAISKSLGKALALGGDKLASIGLAA